MIRGLPGKARGKLDFRAVRSKFRLCFVRSPWDFLSLGLTSLLLANEQEFRLDGPDAQSVGLVGEFNDWKGQAMTRDKDGIWTITISLSPRTYGYKFLVNGSEWIIDPQTTLRKQVNGIENSAVEVLDGFGGAALGSSASAPVSAESPAPATTASPVVGDFPVTPGDVTSFDVPLSPKQRVETTKRRKRGRLHGEDCARRAAKLRPAKVMADPHHKRDGWRLEH